MARHLQQFVEDPRACSYLPDVQAKLEVRVMVDVSPRELEAMLERGWRRFGPCYFRPACDGCGECVTLRIAVADFTPSKSQRRAAKAAARFRRVVGRPLVDRARIALYAKWHADREHERGWTPNPQTSDRYALDFAFPHPSAREASYWDGERLIGLGIFDATPRALSAAFFFYDPEYARDSLGVANVVALVDDARAAGLAHVYLGYRVMGCASLRYKAGYRPHELLVGRPEPNQAPIWRRGATDPGTP